MRPPPSSAPSTFETRAFTPIRNPVYVVSDDDSFKARQPTNVLERPAPAPRGVDERLTSQGTVPPVAGLTPIVPAAYQTPLNVWALYPA